MGMRSLRFPISAMPNPAQRAHGSNPPNPCQEPEVFGFPASLSLLDKGYDVVSTVHSGLKCKLRFTKNGHALLAISAMLNPAQRAHGSNPPSPCQEPEVLGFPASLSLCDKGYDVVSTIHSDFETQMAFHEGMVQRARFSAVLALKLKLLRRADCELFRLHGRVLRRRGTRLLLPLADSLLRRLLSLRAHPPHQTVHRRHPR